MLLDAILCNEAVERSRATSLNETKVQSLAAFLMEVDSGQSRTVVDEGEHRDEAVVSSRAEAGEVQGERGVAEQACDRGEQPAHW